MPKIARTAARKAPPRKAPKASVKTSLHKAAKSPKPAAKAAAKPVAPAPKPPIAPEIIRSEGHKGRRDEVPRRMERDDVPCRSCGIRPGRPTAIIGQLTATELCEVCATLRKERIRQNRASQRGYRL